MYQSLQIIGVTSWCGLGFMRGVNSYKYNHKKHYNTEPYLYLNLFGSGCFGIIIYANPFYLPFSIYKEIYRLEVKLRNLEDEKKTDYYNNLL